MKPIANSIAAMAGDLAEWRQDFHRHPELGYEEERTSAKVAEKLRAFGFDTVETGVGKTGVVGVLHGRNGPGGATIMLRADMDALPIEEATGLPHASTTPGTMHACGHDGHTTMLLGAARHLADTRNFDGTVLFCFQPAEEGGAGAREMLRDGLFKRYSPRAVYGMHNWPGLPAGHMAVKDGPVLASADEFTITVRGVGGHAAEPHNARDPIVAASQIVGAIQSIVARRVNPIHPAVVSITKFQSGNTHNVIPDKAVLGGTTRCFDTEVHELMHAEIARICRDVASAMGVGVEVDRRGDPYPPTINDLEQADFAETVMRDLLGDDVVIRGHPPTMAAEDFSFFANEVPGCYVVIGNGDTAPLHHPEYDFNDTAAPVGVAYWSRLVEMALPA